MNSSPHSSGLRNVTAKAGANFGFHFHDRNRASEEHWHNRLAQSLAVWAAIENDLHPDYEL